MGEYALAGMRQMPRNSASVSCQDVDRRHRGRGVARNSPSNTVIPIVGQGLRGLSWRRWIRSDVFADTLIGVDGESPRSSTSADGLRATLFLIDANRSLARVRRTLFGVDGFDATPLLTRLSESVARVRSTLVGAVLLEPIPLRVSHPSSVDRIRRISTGAEGFTSTCCRTVLCGSVARDVALLRQWMKERSGAPNDPVFPTSRGRHLSVDAVQWLVAKHSKIAGLTKPSLTAKIVSPHVLRHTCAMNLLDAGVDSAVIALWLGHESSQTTQIYVHASMALKEKALARTAPLNTERGRYTPPDKLLAFLITL